ncbi:MAG: hypothetical protein JW825_05775 [Candidatus Methanofastidiosa archaeon]|nr:hypothetical protein [Candidatus Methanofastidiosa archaeon]
MPTSTMAITFLEDRHMAKSKKWRKAEDKSMAQKRKDSKKNKEKKGKKVFIGKKVVWVNDKDD